VLGKMSREPAEAESKLINFKSDASCADARGELFRQRQIEPADERALSSDPEAHPRGTVHPFEQRPELHLTSTPAGGGSIADALVSACGVQPSRLDGIGRGASTEPEPRSQTPCVNFLEHVTALPIKQTVELASKALGRR
jgi:hypothetical protein